MWKFDFYVEKWYNKNIKFFEKRFNYGQICYSVPHRKGFGNCHFPGRHSPVGDAHTERTSLWYCQ